MSIQERIRWAICASAGGSGKGACSNDCACVGDAEAAANAVMPEIERLRAALKKIATMKPEPIAEGFVHGPALLLSHCQREARQALKSNAKRSASND